MRFKYILFFGLVLISFFGCRVSKLKKVDRQELDKLAFAIVFKEKNLNKKLDLKIALGNELKLRTEFLAEENLILTTPVKDKRLFENYSEFVVFLEIPEKFRGRYEFGNSDLDLIKGNQPWAFYSPLLPTNEKSIFFIQKINSVDLTDYSGKIGRGINHTLFFYKKDHDELILIDKKVENLYMANF